MTALDILIVVLVLILATVAAFVLVRASRPEPRAEPPSAGESVAEHDARVQALEDRGTELLERRIQLDARRGVLGGQTQISDAFDALERRLRAGEISEDEFERQKIQLLERGY